MPQSPGLPLSATLGKNANAQPPNRNAVGPVSSVRVSMNQLVQPWVSVLHKG